VKSRVRSREVFVDLIDISEGGCKIRGKSGFATIGDRVTMKVAGVNAPLGTVHGSKARLPVSPSKARCIRRCSITCAAKASSVATNAASTAPPDALRRACKLCIWQACCRNI